MWHSEQSSPPASTDKCLQVDLLGMNNQIGITVQRSKVIENLRLIQRHFDSSAESSESFLLSQSDHVFIADPFIVLFGKTERFANKSLFMVNFQNDLSDKILFDYLEEEFNREAAQLFFNRRDELINRPPIEIESLQFCLTTSVNYSLKAK